MLRITRTSSPGAPEKLTLEGRLFGPWVDELSRVAETAMAGADALVLDLSGVIFVDQGGVMLLRALRSRSVTIQGCSSFVASLLNGGSS